MSSERDRSWLALQAVLALRPQLARPALARGASPHYVLAQLKLEPPERAVLTRAADVHRRVGAVLLGFGEPEYPAGLARLSDAPPVLSVRGAPAVLSQPAVAIVGSRAATRYGLEVAARASRAAVQAGLVVVSGLARGIDRAAHVAALDAGGTDNTSIITMQIKQKDANV